jgi:hypothetical protein
MWQRFVDAVATSFKIPQRVEAVTEFHSRSISIE